MTSSAAKKRSEELTSGYGLPEDALALLQEEVAYALDLAEASGRISERAAVVAWLRGEPERLVACDGHRHADGKPCFVLSPMPADELADDIERGDHRREEEK